MILAVAAAIAFSSPQAAAVAIMGQSARIELVNVDGPYATVRTAGGILEGSPAQRAMLLQHFSFGWQPIDLLTDRCDLSARRLGHQRESRLMLGMPALVVNQGTCEWRADFGPARDIDAVRALMRGPFVPRVAVSGGWALGSWYGAGGGQALFKKKHGTWRLVKSWGGAMSIPELKNRFGVPVDVGCDLARDDRYC